MEKDLRSFFEYRIFKRGEEYFYSGRVGKFEIETAPNGTLRAEAVVSGSEEYDTALWFDQERQSFKEFECSCPYSDSDNCKHSAALGLAFIEKYANERVQYGGQIVQKSAAQSEKERLSAEKIFSALDETASPEEIEKIIKELENLKRERVQNQKVGEIFAYGATRRGNWAKAGQTERRAKPVFALKNYFIAFSKWDGKCSLHLKNNPYQLASINAVLENKETLTEPQKKLMALLKMSQKTDENTPPADIGEMLVLIKESGIALCENYEYGYNTKKFTVDFASEKLRAELRFEEKYDEYAERNKKKFILELPNIRPEFDKNQFLKSEHHLVHISRNAIVLHQMPEDIARIAARAGSPASVYDWQTSQIDRGRARTELTEEETTRVNQIIADAKKYLNLITDLTPDYEIEKFSQAKKILAVDFRAKEETLSIRPIVDYGFRQEDVSETVFISHAGGEISFRRRKNYGGPDTHFIEIDGKKIRHALIQEKTETELFESLHGQNLGPTKTPRYNIKGLEKISGFYETYWPRLKKKCKEIGCEIRFANDIFEFAQENFRADFSVQADAENDWLAFDVSCYCGPDKITILDLRRFVEEGQKFLRRSDGRLLKISNREELERFVAMLESFQAHEEGRFEGKLYHASEIQYVATSSKHYNAIFGKGFEAFMKNAKTGKPVKPVALSDRIRALLRPYQIAGVEWLYFLRSYHFAGILADDMGLGKTIQTLVMLEKERAPKKPSLVVCPKTLLYNWQSEAARFTPKMKTAVVDGFPTERASIIKNAAKYDILITGYASLKKDSELYKKEKIAFNYCVLDEAQFIKNHATKNAQIAKEVDADYRLALTGTPLENSVSEIWSIFDFLMPGFLGSYKTFAARFHKPIMERGDAKALETLRQKISCFMLRRTKEEVLSELPKKIEQTSHCHLDTAQNLLYQEVLTRVKSDIFKTVKEQGFNKSRIHILAGLTKLRQICNHPNLLLKEKNYRKHSSAKLDMFNELVEEIRENKRKALVFSQFTEMLDILGKELEASSVPYSYLSGKTKNRHELITSFNADPNIPVFLISLKAGGTGLNLASADTVIIFDPWWNPSVENQAIGRAHRIGQKKSVNVYRLITAGTIEEKIVALQNKKKSLFDSIVDKSRDLFQKLTWDDVQKLFQ